LKEIIILFKNQVSLEKLFKLFSWTEHSCSFYPTVWQCCTT